MASPWISTNPDGSSRGPVPALGTVPTFSPTLGPAPTPTPTPTPTPAPALGPPVPSVYDTAASQFRGANDVFTRNAGAGNIAQTMNQYINPYQQQVTNNAISRMQDGREQALNVVGANAQAAGAFGGSRHGLVESEIYNNTNRNIGDLTAQSNAAGFNAAAGLANQDIANQLTSAGNLSALGTQNFGIGQAIGGQQAQQGAQQQSLIQAILTGGANQFDQYVNHPIDSLNTHLALLGANPLNGESTQTYQPGLLDFLGLGGQTGGQFAQGKG